MAIKKNQRKILDFLRICSILFISGQQVALATKITPSQAFVGTTLAVDFAPDGRLWRLLPTSHAIYVDYSIDQGKHFSAPIKINHLPQKITAWAENPPLIKVSKSGMIHVLYYADAAQNATSFYSYSADHGTTFSKPITVSDHAQSAMHYMDQMLLSGQNKVYLFWHDMRHGIHDQQLGSGVLSLYYATSSNNGASFINHKLADNICSCCRTAVDLGSDDLPVILVRMVFKGGIRDHALLKIQSNSKPEVRRITQDQWQIDACPEHGPALSIDKQGRSHLTWFTLGATRKGIYYAYSDDYAKTLSVPISLGNQQKIPSHPDVIAAGKRVVLAWLEFDGKHTSVVVKQSNNKGETWSIDATIIKTNGKNSYPNLLKNGKKIYLSWLTKNNGHKFILIKND